MDSKTFQSQLAKIIPSLLYFVHLGFNSPEEKWKHGKTSCLQPDSSPELSKTV